MQGRAAASAETRDDGSAWAVDALVLFNDVPRVHRVGLALSEGGGRRLRFTASDRAEEAPVEWCHIDAYDDVPLNTAIRTGDLVAGAMGQLDQRYPEFVARQRGTATVAVAAVPIVAAGRTVGGFVLFFDHEQEFGPLQRLELQRVGVELGGRLLRAQRAEPRRLIDMSAGASGPGVTAVVYPVPADPAAVSEARRSLRRTLENWGIDEETTDSAVLCLSELITNAVIHAGADCVVRVVLEQGTLTTTVRDTGRPNAALAAPTEGTLQVHGRGLGLVDSLVVRWGSEVDSAGTTVWFVLET